MLRPAAATCRRSIEGERAEVGFGLLDVRPACCSLGVVLRDERADGELAKVIDVIKGSEGSAAMSSIRPGRMGVLVS